MSKKGRAVVDYVFVPHDDLKTVSAFCVDTCSDIITNLGINNMVSDICKVPDHSLLTFKVGVSRYSQILCQNLGARNYYSLNTNRKYNVRNMPNDFMTSDGISNAINQLIDDINLLRENQTEVERAYDRLLDILIKEMNDKLSYVKLGRRKQTPFKPYWVETLSNLWQMAQCKTKHFF